MARILRKTLYIVFSLLLIGFLCLPSFLESASFCTAMLIIVLAFSLLYIVTLAINVADRNDQEGR